MKGIATATETTSIMAGLVKGLRVNQGNCKKAMTSELFATDKALKLVAQGVPFRDAYRMVKKEF